MEVSHVTVRAAVLTFAMDAAAAKPGEKPDTCRPCYRHRYFRIISLINVDSLLRLGGPERVYELIVHDEYKATKGSKRVSTMVAYLNHSTHMNHYYVSRLINLSLLPVFLQVSP